MRVAPTSAHSPQAAVDPTAPASLLRVHAGVPLTQVVDALNALAQVPLADRQLLAARGIKVDLTPHHRYTGRQIGLTDVAETVSGQRVVNSINVAADARDPGQPTAHILAHEVGHAVSYLRGGDASEYAAERYCLAVLRSPADQAMAVKRMHEHGMNVSFGALGAQIAVAAQRLLGS